MRTLIPVLLLMLVSFAGGFVLQRNSAPSPVAATTSDEAALAALRADSQRVQAQVAALAAEIAALRNSLSERPAPVVIQSATPEQMVIPDGAPGKPARDALERYRAATGNQRPPSPADLVPYFVDPLQAEAFLKKRDADSAPKTERQELRTELKSELKQKLKAGSTQPAVP